MATRKAGITAIKRVTEDELRKAINKENEARKARQKPVAEGIREWALGQSAFNDLKKVSGIMFDVQHPLLPRNSYGQRPGHHEVHVEVRMNSAQCEGRIIYKMKLPRKICDAVAACKELMIQYYEREAELLASRVLLRGEGGDLEKTIAHVVRDYVVEQTTRRPMED